MRKVEVGGYKGWVSPALELTHGKLLELLQGEDLPKAELLLQCAGRRLYRAQLVVDGRRRSCFIYYFSNRSLHRALRRCYALHIWKIAEKLRRAGFNTLEALAAFRIGKEWLNWNSILIVREIANVCELPSGGNHIFRIHTATRMTPEIAEALARTVARLHDKGFVHGDLKSRHVLVQQPSENEFHLVDLEKCKIGIDRFALVHDLFSARDLIQLRASLPGSLNGDPPTSSEQSLLKTYLERRDLKASRRKRIRRWVEMYGPHGFFRQGETVAEGLLRNAGLRRS